MRLPLFSAMLVITLSNSAILRGNDDLFSQLAMESVFESSTASSDTKSVAKPADGKEISRVTGIASLTPILRAAELEPTVEGDQIEFDFDRAGWIFPVTLSVDLERERIVCDFSLIEIDNSETVDRDIVLQLMGAGDPARSAFFAFDSGKKLFRLRASVSNRNVSASGLVSDLERLARLADSQSKLWSELGGKEASSSAPAPNAASNPDPPSKANSSPNSKATGTNGSFSLDGRWSASVASGEAFAVQFEPNDRFALVHLKGGKSTKSTGKAIRNGNRLVLQGDDGTKLTCSVIWKGTQSFQLTIQDAKGNPAVKLEFKKQV